MHTAMVLARLVHVYLVPVDEVGTVVGTLRLDPPRNNQKSAIRWAKDFEVRPPG